MLAVTILALFIFFLCFGTL